MDDLRSEKGKPPPTQTPPGVLDFCGYFFLRARLAGVGHTLNGSAGIAAVGICFRNQNCAATAPSWQPAAAFSSKPSFAAADQCGFERDFRTLTVEEPFNSCFISSSPGDPLENEQCALLATKLLGTSPEGRAL